MRQVKKAPPIELDREEIDELCVDDKFVIRTGETVKVKHDEGRRNGFRAPVTGIHRYPDGSIEVDVYGKRGTRTFRPERLERVPQRRK